MEHFNSVIFYLGKNLKPLVVSVIIKFIFFMMLLTLSLIAFFSLEGTVNKPSIIISFFIMIIIVSLLADRKIFFKYTFVLLKNYLLYLSNEVNEEKNQNNISKHNNSKIKSNKVLMSVGLIIIPKKFSDCFALLSNTYPNTEFDKEIIKKSYFTHLKQTMTEWTLSIALSSPFFLISILLTIGYNSAILILSIILAFIFFLFIKSSVISPAFYLITLKKMKESLRPAF